MKLFHIFFLFLVFCLGGCSGAGKDKILTIGIDESYPPFSFKKGLEPAGFDVDLVSAVLENIGYKANFKLMEFDKIENALENEEIDIAAGGLSATLKRAKKFLFSDGYYSPNFCVIYKKTKFRNDFVKLEDLKSESKIGVQKETVIFDFLENFLQEKRNLNFEIVQYANNFDMLHAVQNNEINFFVTEDLQAELLVQNSQDLGYFVVNSDLTQEKESYAFAFNKKNKKLARLFDIELRNLEENGKIDILKLRWFSSYGIYANILK